MSKIAGAGFVFGALFFASTANADWSANIGGVDISECGLEAYPEFTLTDQ